MCAGAPGDGDGVPLEECAVRMARTGAHLVGLNCLFDPYMTVANMRTVGSAFPNVNY